MPIKTTAWDHAGPMAGPSHPHESPWARHGARWDAWRNINHLAHEAHPIGVPVRCHGPWPRPMGMGHGPHGDGEHGDGPRDLARATLLCRPWHGTRQGWAHGPCRMEPEATGPDQEHGSEDVAGSAVHAGAAGQASNLSGARWPDVGRTPHPDGDPRPPGWHAGRHSPVGFRDLWNFQIGIRIPHLGRCQGTERKRI